MTAAYLAVLLRPKRKPLGCGTFSMMNRSSTGRGRRRTYSR